MYFALLIVCTCVYYRHLIIYLSLISVVIHYRESCDQPEAYERTAIELQTIYHTQTF